jgi:NTE family protein
LKKLLSDTLGNITFEDLKIPFQCTASDLLSGQLVVFSKGDLVTAVQASSSIPGLFRPVRHEDKLLIDGGVLCRVPSRQVKAMGADVVIGLDVLYNTSQPVNKPSNLVRMLLRVFDMMDNNAAQYAKKANEDVCDLYLEPKIEGYSQYMVKGFELPFNEGYALGKEYLPKIKKLLKD